MPDHTHIEIGTILVRKVDLHKWERYCVTAETRLSWKAHRIWPNGELDPMVTTINKSTLIDRDARGCGYDRVPFCTLATHERHFEAACLRRDISAQLDECTLETLREIAASIDRQNIRGGSGGGVVPGSRWGDP